MVLLNIEFLKCPVSSELLYIGYKDSIIVHTY